MTLDWLVYALGVVAVVFLVVAIVICFGFVFS